MAIQTTKPGATLMVGIIMNRLVDKCGGVEDQEREAAVRLVIAEYGEMLKAASTTKRVMAFYPYPRAGLQWTVDMLPLIHDTLKLVLMGSTVTLLPYLPVATEDFMTDGTHLSEQAQAAQFDHFIMYLRLNPIGVLVTQQGGGRKRPQGEALAGTSKKLAVSDSPIGTSFSGEPFDVDAIEVVIQPGSTRRAQSDTLLMDLSRPPPMFGVPVATARLPETLIEIRDRVVSLERDGLVFQGAVAELNLEQVSNCELIDTALNNNNANVVIIDNLLKMGNTANGEAKEVVEELCTLLGQELTNVKAAYYLKLGKNPEADRHFKIKAIFSSVDTAIAFRVGASKTRRENKTEPWKTSYISNDPTKSTRVRIEIMKQIGATLAKQPSLAGFEFFVTRYDTKPVMVQKQGAKIVRRVGYVETIQKFAHLLQNDQLKVARKIAGKQFEGRFFLNFGI